jgi:amino acid adenylation domain-containing protein/FkbM family methyltransferase
MIPSAFVELAQFPLTPNGKLDRKALPAPDLAAVARRDYAAPEGELEAAIADIWQGLLGLPRVSRWDNFFDLGGHSLLAVQLRARLEQTLQVDVSLRQIFAQANLAELAALVADAKPALHTSIAPADRSVALPLSWAQQRLWFLDQLDHAAGAAYHMPAALRLRGNLDKAALQAALDCIVARHEALRTTFVRVDGEPVQVIAPAAAGFALRQRDLSALAGGEQATAVARLAADEVSHPFDLASGPLVRGQLLCLGAQEHVLLITQHHIISDGWSIGVLVREVSSLYAAFSQRLPDPLPPLAIQYADYSAWQRAWLQGEALQTQRDFWQAQLGGAPALLALPTDRPRPPVQTYAGAIHTFALRQDTSAALRAVCQQHGATLFMVMLAGWSVLMARLSGQDDVVIGTPVANRNHAELEPLIGFFANTLALRVRLAADLRVDQLLADIKALTLDVYAHQDLPFEQVVDVVKPPRSLAHSPLFQSMIRLDNASSAPQLELPGLTVAPLPTLHLTTRFDLTLALAEDGDAIVGNIEYASDLFDPATIDRLGRQFCTLMGGIAADTTHYVGALPLLDEEERALVLHGFNETAVSYPQDKLVHQLFEEQVTRTPDALALVFEDDALTYDVLNQRANVVAHTLLSMGVRPDSLVAICIERSLEMVVGLLGILKAGAAYVPLDPSYPEERLSYMLDDSAPAAVLTSAKLHTSLPLLAACRASIVRLDAMASSSPSDWLSNPDPLVLGLAPHHLAYVIYTSGSTGMPKGVMNQHNGVVNRLLWAQDEYALEANDRVLQKTPFSFDVSVWEFYLPLLAGSTLVMARPNGHQDPHYLVELIVNAGITMLHFVPSMLQVFLDQADAAACTSVRHLLCSGEALPYALQVRCQEQLPHMQLHNLYGPTEAAIDVTAWRCNDQHAGIVPIGRPIANIQIYILDVHMQPVPIGIAGELYIGGAGVARGYLNRPELSAERFIADPFGKAGARLYKTGDLGRWLADGNIEYLGRNDFQVKLRGLRIELGEIEARLREHPGVNDAVVVTRPDASDQQRLVAYLAPSAQALPVTRWLQLQAKDTDTAARNIVLPNGMRVFHQNPTETTFLYDEIFGDEVYLKHGIALGDDACVFDVGANIGLFSLFVAKRCRAARVYAFEPIPPVFASLERNTALYGLGGRVYACGLAAQPGVEDFDFYPHNTVISSSRTSAAEAREVVRAFIENRQERSCIEADAAALDAMLDERLGTERYRCQLRTVSEIIAENAIEHIDLLKIDVENAELGVLQGIAPGDWPKIAQLVVEVHDVDGRLSHITAMLEAQGFTVICQQEQSLRTTAIFNLYAVRAERPAPPPASGWAWEWCSERELIASVRENLSKHLPDYMLPSAFVVLDAFPLSPNGKLDRKALPEPGQDAVASRAYQAPQGDVEQALAAIWQDLLGLERIGRHDHFFELGGHSLMAIGLIERLRRHGLSADVRTVFEAPTLLEMAARVEAAQAKRAFVVPPNLIAPDCVAITPAMLPLVTLTQDEIDRVVATVPGGAANIQDIYPLAPLQEGILFHHLLGGEGDAYLLRSMLRLDTRQRLDTFLVALQTVVARHDILRSAIRWHGLSQPVQVVYRSAALPVHEVTLSGGDPLLQLQRQSDPRQLRLELQRAPLLKAFIGADPASDAWFLSLLNHHIVSDHITLELILAEIEAELLGQRDTLAPSLPYRNFIAQTRAVPQQDHEAYFRAQLGDIDEPSAPFGVLDVLADAQPFAESRLELDAALAADVRRRSRAAGVTSSVLFHLAWAMVVAECSARDDVVFGTVVSGRLAGGEGIERALGMFINTLPVRVTLGARSVHAVVLAVHQAITGLLPHEQCPLSLAQRCSGVASGMPLFTALLNYRHSKAAPALGESGQQLAWDGMRLIASEERTNYPLAMSVDDAGTGFVLTAQSCCADPERVNAYLQRALEVLVNALDHEPHRLMSTLTILPPAEQEQLVSGFNANAVDYPKEQLIHGLFESQAVMQPDAVALVTEEGSLTYAALNRRANQLAHYLVARGVRPDTRVGICLERGLDMVVGLLGILKAGGAYVPLDPAHPPHRIAYMVRDSGCVLVLSHSYLRPVLDLEDAPAPLFFFDESEQLLAQQDVHDPQARVLGLRADHLAYVIYTSGSTGMPKGVMNQHDGVVNRLLWARDAYAIGQDDRILQKTPFNFDVSVWEFFLPLLAGAQLVMARPGGHKDPDYLARVIEKQAITTLHFVPSMLQLFLEHVTLRTACPHLRQVLCSGEALPYSLQLSFHRHLPAVELHNLYGPTEAAIDVTAWHCVPETHVGIVPIGRPIANTQIYILDAHMRPAPLGVSGELYIGGVGVARGYINRPELTTERFVASPFVPGAKLYKTGDLGRWLDDGSVEYLGRNDFQVKIRGMRIELGEIEHALLACPGVGHAIVIAQPDHGGEQQLLAYLLPQKQSQIAVESLRAQLSARLAEYMVPSAFIVLDAFPVTANGKLDRRALPMPDLAARQSAQYEAPSNTVETTLANLWQQLLDIPRVGRHDHFFELGGHSFLAVQLLSKLRTELGVEVGLRELFLAPTLHRFAEVVGQRRDSQRYSNLVPIRPEGSGRPLFLVHPGGLGSLRYAHDIARHLDPDVPIYGLAPRGLVDGEDVLQAVEDMAENYLRAVRHIQPHGPYRLAGWSAGGTIAYEMANQLVGADERVEFLGLIDTHSAYQPAAAKANGEALDAEGHGRFDGIAAVLAWLPADLPAARMAKVKRHAAERNLDAMLACCQEDGLLPPDVEPDILRRHVVAALALDTALRRYCIHRIPVSVTVFAATQDEAPSCIPGWERIAGKNVRIIPIAANHMTITEGEHLEVLVREMFTLLQQAEHASQNYAEHEYEPCVTIQHGRKGITPLFCMPGAGASVTALFELSQALGPDIPVYGLQPRGLCGDMTPYVNVESAAGAYVRAIRQIQKSGPYHLLGHSYGGWIAIEMARQLERAGETIGSLTVLDTEAPSDGKTARVRYSRSAMFMKLVELFELNLPVPMGICAEDFSKRDPEQQLVFMLERAIAAGIFPATTNLKSMRGLVRVFECNINTHYQPAGMYEGRLNLVSVPDMKATAPDVAYDPAPLIAAWRLHAREVLHRDAAGNHLSLLMQPDVSSLAQTIRDIALVETKVPFDVGGKLQSTLMP